MEEQKANIVGVIAIPGAILALIGWLVAVFWSKSQFFWLTYGRIFQGYQTRHV